MAIRNLVLDMGNVLLSWEPRAFALQAAGNAADTNILYDALFGSPQWAQHDAGQIDEAELLRAAMDRTPEQLHDTLRQLHAHWPQWMAPVPGASAFARAAHEAGLRLYLLSNAGTHFPAALEDRDFYPLFDGMLISAHERLAKPDPRIYQRLCERFGLAPRECLFVDDMAVNAEGARQAGMLAHHFDGDWDKVAHRLHEHGVMLRW